MLVLSRPVQPPRLRLKSRQGIQSNSGREAVVSSMTAGDSLSTAEADISEIISSKDGEGQASNEASAKSSSALNSRGGSYEQQAVTHQPLSSQQLAVALWAVAKLLEAGQNELGASMAPLRLFRCVSVFC